MAEPLSHAAKHFSHTAEYLSRMTEDLSYMVEHFNYMTEYFCLMEIDFLRAANYLLCACDCFLRTGFRICSLCFQSCVVKKNCRMKTSGSTANFNADVFNQHADHKRQHSDLFRFNYLHHLPVVILDDFGKINSRIQFCADECLFGYIVVYLYNSSEHVVNVYCN